MGCWHPRLDEHGERLWLASPSTASDLSAWADPSATACVLPDGPMPVQLADRLFQSWSDRPTTQDGWQALAATMPIDEPPFEAPPGRKRSAGVGIREPDGRLWMVVPSNHFAGYTATFPKGHLDAGDSPASAALRECWEETGLQVRLLSFLADSTRTTVHARYYLAERVGGNPADMGWETQAVLLVPPAQSLQWLNRPHDQALVQRLG